MQVSEAPFRHVDFPPVDFDLAKTFFRKLRLVLYGGAGLDQPVYDRLQQLAVDTIGHKIMLTTGYGATETTSGAMSIYFESDQVGIGLPMPGLSVKMVPIGDRYELRMKGLMVTPGYLSEDELNANIRYEEGFYKIGDTARFHDPGAPEKSLAFTGRLAEEFKLANDTWVSAGNMRMNLAQASRAVGLRSARLRRKLRLCRSARLAQRSRIAVRGRRFGDTPRKNCYPTMACARQFAKSLESITRLHRDRAIGSPAFPSCPASRTPRRTRYRTRERVNQALAKHNRPEAIKSFHAAAPGTAIIATNGD